MKSKVIKALITCLIIGVISISGYYGYKKFFAAKPVQASAQQYITATAKKMNMQVNVQGTGAAYAAVSKDIMPNNNGTLKDLNLKVGDTVKSGDKLFTSDSDDLRQNVDKAQNNLDKQKLSLANAKNDNETAMDNLAVNDAQNQLNYAWKAVNNMAVTSPINGIIVTENNSNGDNIQSGKAVMTVMDPSSMKVKVAIDELDIAKVSVGQKAQITFDALKDKNYDGTVESVSQTGTSNNNVTTYDVVVAIKNPAGIKVGMNANVNIMVSSKENTLTIPSEALIESNGKKYVIVPSSNSNSTGANNSGRSNQQGQNGQFSGANGGQFSNGNTQGQNGNGQYGNIQNGNSQRQNRNGQGSNGQGRYAGGMGSTFSSIGRRVEVTTGLENENYVEILSGIDEGQKVLIALPQTSSTTNNMNRNAFGGGLGGFGGGFGGNMGGGASRQRTSTGGNNKGN